MLRTHVLRTSNCVRTTATRPVLHGPGASHQPPTMQFSRGSRRRALHGAAGPAPELPWASFLHFSGASIAVGSAAMLYFLLNNKDRAMMVPLYVHLANARGLLHNELDEDELRDLQASITRQLTARVAVDETIGSLLGVPVRTVSIDTTEMTVRAPARHWYGYRL